VHIKAQNVTRWRAGMAHHRVEYSDAVIAIFLVCMCEALSRALVVCHPLFMRYTRRCGGESIAK